MWFELMFLQNITMLRIMITISRWAIYERLMAKPRASHHLLSATSNFSQNSCNERSVTVLKPEMSPCFRESWAWVSIFEILIIEKQESKSKDTRKQIKISPSCSLSKSKRERAKLWVTKKVKPKEWNSSHEMTRKAVRHFQLKSEKRVSES